MNVKWGIVRSDQLAMIDYSVIHQTSEESLRLSADGEEALIKWNANEVNPHFIANMSDTRGPFTREEIMEILQDGWTDPGVE